MPELHAPPDVEDVASAATDPADDADVVVAVHGPVPAAPGALAYALSLPGVLLTLLGCAGLGLARFTLHAAEALGPFGTAMVGFGALAVLAYVSLWLHEVVADSKDGHPRLPGYPDPTDLEAILAAASTGVTAAFFAAVPLGLALGVGLDGRPVRIVLGLLALLYLPAAFVGLVGGDRAFGALPASVLRTLAVHPARVAAVAAFALAAAPAVVTRLVDAPLPLDVAADALATFALLVSLRRLSV